MKRSRFSEEEIIGILREAEAGTPIKAVWAAHNISTATYHAWKRKSGGMEVSEAQETQSLAFASLPCWTNTPGNAWPFILGGRSEPSM